MYDLVNNNFTFTRDLAIIYIVYPLTVKKIKIQNK